MRRQRLRLVAEAEDKNPVSSRDISWEILIGKTLWLTWCCCSSCPSAHRSGLWSQSSWKILSGNLVWIAFPKGSQYSFAFDFSVYPVHGVLINLVFNLVHPAPAWWISPASSPRSSWPRGSGPSPCSWSWGWGRRTLMILNLPGKSFSYNLRRIFQHFLPDFKAKFLEKWQIFNWLTRSVRTIETWVASEYRNWSNSRLKNNYFYRRFCIDVIDLRQIIVFVSGLDRLKHSGTHPPLQLPDGHPQLGLHLPADIFKQTAAL